MESYPEQHSDGFRLNKLKEIHAAYSRSGLDLHELAKGLLELRPSDSLLDVGCGLGDFLIDLRMQGHFGRLVGIDISAELIGEARKTAVASGAEIDFKVYDAKSIGFNPANFDCVTAIGLPGSVCVEKTLMEIGRVIKLDGRVVISTDSRSCFPLLEEIRNKARDRFGWIMPPSESHGLVSENAPEILRRFFGTVEEFRYEDSIQYPDAEVLVDLFRSTPGMMSDGLSEEEWARIIDWARDQALEIIPEHGYAEDPTRFSLFRCSSPLGL